MLKYNQIFNFLRPVISRQSVKNLHTNVAPTGKSFHHLKRVTLIPGDGVWPELFTVVKSIFKEIDVPVVFEEFNLSGSSDLNSEQFKAAMDSLKKTRVGLKGTLKTPLGNLELDTINMKMRRELDLYANVVHIQSLPGLEARHGPLDFVIIREQLEGEYSMLEHESVKGVVESLKIITKRNSERIAKFAFDYAVRNGRSTVTVVHKANIMKLTDGLFMECCRNVSNLYPHITCNFMIVDNCCMQMVSRPDQFDVLVMPNLYGNIIDNLAAGLVGGSGVVPGVSYSHEIALFEPGTRHSYSRAIGKTRANPTAALLTSVNLLRHINLHEHATRLETGVKRVIEDQHVLTDDMGGQASTDQFAEAVLNKVHAA